MTETLLEVKHLSKSFPIKRGFWSKTVGEVKAVNDVNLNIKKGEIIGIVGESGCGKSTLGKLILKLIEPTNGEVYYAGKNILKITNNETRELRKKIQIIFQNPYSSLNPRMTIGEIISEPIIVHKLLRDKTQIANRVNELLELVGLDKSLAKRYPHELSGGQRQRIAIARVLSLNPEFVILDEPVSALDVSVQAQILNLLLELQKKLQLTYLFISHNLSVVNHISSKVAVMYLGNIVEYGDKETILNNPKHPYTKALISAAPIIDYRQETTDKRPERTILQGEIPDPANPPSGCTFRTRCPIVQEICAKEVPLLIDHKDTFCACHFADN